MTSAKVHAGASTTGPRRDGGELHGPPRSPRRATYAESTHPKCFFRRPYAAKPRARCFCRASHARNSRLECFSRGPSGVPSCPMSPRRAAHRKTTHVGCEEAHEGRLGTLFRWFKWLKPFENPLWGCSRRKSDGAPRIFGNEARARADTQERRMERRTSRSLE